jgi:hypothetical protein
MTAAPLTWAVAGHAPTADELATLMPLKALKAADFPNGGTTTFANDPELVVSLDASASFTVIYEWYAYIKYSADAANDFKWQFTLPTGATNQFALDPLDSGSTTAQGAAYHGTYSESTAGIVAGGIGSGNIAYFRARGYVQVGSTAGSAQFKFAQNATGAPDICICRANSHMTFRRVQ